MDFFISNRASARDRTGSFAGSPRIGAGFQKTTKIKMGGVCPWQFYLSYYFQPQ